MSHSAILTHSYIPLRLHASLTLTYESTEDRTFWLIQENGDPIQSPHPNRSPILNQIALYCDSKFSFRRNNGMGVAEWVPSYRVNSHVTNDVEAFCFLALLCSDSFCPRQTILDWKQVKSLPYWQKLLDEMAENHIIASVMVV